MDPKCRGGEEKKEHPFYLNLPHAEKAQKQVFFAEAPKKAITAAFSRILLFWTQRKKNVIIETIFRLPEPPKQIDGRFFFCFPGSEILLCGGIACRRRRKRRKMHK